MADTGYHPVPLTFEPLPAHEQAARLHAFHERMLTRRTVRHYSGDPVPDALIDRAIAVAGSAPSGANLQPWHFVVVRDPDVKRRIREAAEEEERNFYEHRAPEEWLAALAPLGTDSRKECLETAPCLIVVFRVAYVRISSRRAARGGSGHKPGLSSTLPVRGSLGPHHPSMRRPPDRIFCSVRRHERRGLGHDRLR